MLLSTRYGTRSLVLLAVLGPLACAHASFPESAPPTAGYCSPQFQATVGWPDPDRAARVCQCESSGNPRALAGNGAYAGLFQFSRDTWQSLGGGDVFDPRLNSARALQLWRKRGWKPWPSCSSAR